MDPPVKVVRHCLTCNSQAQGHLRNLRNVAMRNIMFKEHFEVLECDLQELSNDRFVMCEACMKNLEKVFTIKTVLKKNLADNKLIQERRKRMILHSVSPVVKKFVRNRLTPVKPRKSVKQMLKINTEKECPLETVSLEAPSEQNATSDHLYSAPINTTSQAEHTYAANNLRDKSPGNLNPYHSHKKNVLCPLLISKGSKELLEQAVNNMSQGIISAEEMLEAIVSIPLVFERLWQIIVLKISVEMDQICSLKQPSVLRSKVTDIKVETFFRDILLEMHERCPRALDFLMFMACPVQLKMPEESYVIQAMYVMAMYSRNCQLIAFQKCVAASCIRYNAGNGLLGLMHTMGLSVPEQTKLTLLDELGKINGKEVIAVLNQGETLKITVDNIDGRIKANQVRLDGGNRDFHYTHWSVIIDRFHPRDLQDPSIEPKAVSAGGPDPKTFFLSKEEHASLRKCYSWLVQRILIEDVPALSVFCLVVHPVLNHKYRKVIDRPTDVYHMFVIMKDPKSLTNCVQIMDTILGTLQSLYTTAGRDVDENGEPVHASMMTTVRVPVDSIVLHIAGVDENGEPVHASILTAVRVPADYIVLHIAGVDENGEPVHASMLTAVCTLADYIVLNIAGVDENGEPVRASVLSAVCTLADSIVLHIAGVDENGEPVHASMYKYLWIIGGKEFHEFPDYTFEDHNGKLTPSYGPRVMVRDYMEGKWSKGAGGKLKDYIKFNTAVRYVKYENETKTSIVTVEDVAKKETREETFTHVIVASGIYSFPNTPTFPGIESFGGRVIHSHDLRSARHFHGQRVLVIGAAYSGEDIPTQLIKFGAQNVTLAFRRQPKRYRNHFPFLESRFRIDDETHPYPAGLYNGTLFHKEGNNNLFYIGVLEQFHTFTYCEALAYWTCRFIRGDFKQEPVSREEMQKSADEWHQLANECKNEHDIVRFQARVIKHLVEAADYPYPEICQMEPLLLE
ncbi:uncharacterized protein LOC128238094 [Mya arenaria]|uniref:uncharacterized protein LOC128238094 n=1 Tax=Mya arenaria TaxID=6604 RepID=UPI0022DF1683|nr:uncharacterized protein LOC128238094 [Mya arenaria]